MNLLVNALLIPPDKSPPQGARKLNNSEVPASRDHKKWWELGEHARLPPPIPEVGFQMTGA